MRKAYLLALCMMLCICEAVAQSGTTTRKGYLIHFGYDWYFQPADTPNGIFESLANKASFNIQIGMCGDYNALSAMEDSLYLFDSVQIDFLYTEEQKKHSVVMKYSYCEITFYNPTWDGPHNAIPCRIEVYHNDKIYPLGSYDNYWPHVPKVVRIKNDN